MKAYLLRLRERVDALKMRERIALFGMFAALIVFVASAAFLNPLFAKRTALRAELKQQNDNIAGIDAEIIGVVAAHQRDPDAAARVRLAALKAATARMAAQLRSMQGKLVPADRMARVLGDIMRDHGRLRLMAMKTLPVRALLDDVKATPGAAVRPASLIYRHAVELTVRGRYLDMVAYMAALEAMPVQLFWSHAELEVEQYPDARLTLTLYTLSLDEKWMTL